LFVCVTGAFQFFGRPVVSVSKNKYIKIVLVHSSVIRKKR